MADFTTIKQEIDDNVNTNGVGAITGAILNTTLNDMVDTINAAKEDLIADGYIYGGKVNPYSTPSADKRLFYIAEQEGTYTNFGGLYLTGTSIFIIKWNDNTQNWTTENFGITYAGVDIEITQRFRMLYLELGFDSFSPSMSYTIGDYVTKVDIGGLYRFTSNHSGAWDDNDVEEVTLVDYIDDLLSGVNDKADKVTGATAGNFAGLDSNGNLTDSGSKASDFATAAQGAKADTAYQLPSGGIPSSDMANAVQTSLGKADTAYQKPATGIPSSDMSTAVQTSLGLADTAIQDVSGKMDKVPSATVSNIAQFASGGGVVDSGVNVFDLAVLAEDASTPPASMEPNTVYKYGTLAGNTTFPALATPTNNDIANVYCWTFATPATAPTITWPVAITDWAGGSAPTINASKKYEVSVMDGLATIIEA